MAQLFGVVASAAGGSTIITIIIVLAVLLAVFLLLFLVRSRSVRSCALETEAPAAVETALQPAAEGINAKTVAAIMAAVSAMSGRPAAQLKFTAIHRVPGFTSSWAASGINQIINTRQNYL